MAIFFLSGFLEKVVMVLCGVSRDTFQAVFAQIFYYKALTLRNVACIVSVSVLHVFIPIPVPDKTQSSQSTTCSSVLEQS